MCKELWMNVKGNGGNGVSRNASLSTGEARCFHLHHHFWYDSNDRAKAWHITNGGQLPNNIKEPTFLADPSHQKRVFARAIYNLASAPKKTSSITKGMAGHLKYCYRACIKRNRHLPEDQLSSNVYNILDHVCNDHGNCDVAWCYNAKR